MDKFNPDAHNANSPKAAEVQPPHSGVFNDEYPVREYKETPLEEAVKLPDFKSKLPEDQEVTVASFTGQSPETVEVIESIPVKPEKKKLSLSKKLTAGAVGIVLASGAAFGISQAINSGEDNTPPEKNPNDNSQVDEEPAPIEEEPSNVIPEKIASYSELTWEDFQREPRNDQLSYVDYRIDMNAELHATAVGERDRTTWTEPSKDMPAQGIVDNFNYVLDEVGMSYKVDSEANQVLDKDEAIKILSGAYYDTGSPVVTKAFLNDRERVLSKDNLFITDQKYTAVSESEIQVGDDQFGNPTEYKEIIIENQHGETFTTEFVYIEYTNIDGDPASTWLLYKQNLNQ